MNSLKLLLSFILLIQLFISNAAPNCNIYPKGSECREACELSYKAIELPQGSKKSQLYFDSAIAACSTFAYAWVEKSVPYLKRGDFDTWRKLLDKGVELDPSQYLGYRAACLMSFVRDYKGAIRDLERLKKIQNGSLQGSNPSGDFCLLLVLAISKRELGDYKGAMEDFNSVIANAEKENWLGPYDYLYRGITHHRLKNYKAALSDFEDQIKHYKDLADTYYYLGLVYEDMGSSVMAKNNFQLAYEKYTTTGVHMEDWYNVLPDQVFLSDIKAKLN
jgi:tetratricopeptide (TPR) repeat protein